MNKMTTILIMGLPNSGKTTLSGALKYALESHNKKVDWINADQIREQFNDWDFSIEGRIRQSRRMRLLASNHQQSHNYVICDFVAPLPKMREIFNADFTVWVDTITESPYSDTNNLFVPPEKYDVHVTEQDSEKWAAIICQKLLQL